MKNSYTTIYYKDQKISNIFSATLESDFYDEALLGAVEIIEESIPKRDLPYFYGISRSPLEFEVVFAFKKPMSIYEIREYVEMFYSNDYYQSLAFEREDGFMTPIYYVLAAGEPEIEYNRVGVDEYVGYFKLNFRCNAPYGFTEGEVENKDLYEDLEKSFKFYVNSSEKSQYYIIELENATENPINNIELKNTTTGESFKLSAVESEETIIIDGRNRRLSSNIESNPNDIYLRLVNRDDDFITLVPGYNIFTIDENIRVKIIYRAPRFI